MSRTSVLPAGVTLVGAIEGAGDLVVAGTVEGPIELEGGLVIEEGGRVDGDVSVTTLIVRGVLTGDAAARETIRLEGSAMVVGDAVAPRVHIVDGARVRGRVRMNGEPMVPKAVRRAPSSAGKRRAPEPASSPAVSSERDRAPEDAPTGHVRREHVPPQLARDDDEAIALEGAPTAVGAPAALDEDGRRPRRKTRSKPQPSEGDSNGDEGRRSKRRRRGRRRGGRDRGDGERTTAPGDRPAPSAEPTRTARPAEPETPRAAAPKEETPAERAPRKRRRPPAPNMPTVGRQKAKRKDRSDATPSS